MLKQQESKPSNKLSITFTLFTHSHESHALDARRDTHETDSVKKVPTLGAEDPENPILSGLTEPWSSL